MSQPEQENLMHRREAIRRVSLMLGGLTLVGGSTLVAACEREGAHVPAAAPVGDFSTSDIALLDEVAETILPETKTPGAKAAQVGAFMARMVTDCYDTRDQKVFRDGMKQLDDASRKANGTTFMSATPKQRLTLVEQLDREQKRYMDARDAAQRKQQQGGVTLAGDTLPKVAADAPAHYFRMIKELTLLGYFTSEIGCTKAQRYAETPGRYEPCVPYRPGEKSWASHA